MDLINQLITGGGQMAGGTPSHHPFLDGMFPNKNHPFWESPINGNPYILVIINGNQWDMNEHEHGRKKR